MVQGWFCIELCSKEVTVMNKEYLIYKLSDEVKNSCKIDKDAFSKFNVKRGLRN